MSEKANADILLEVSWEVCNKVGGINTVIKSKTPRILEQYGDKKYIAIGPYFANKVAGESEELPHPKTFHKICNDLEKEGIKLHFGKWLIKGEPKTILLDFQDYLKAGDQIKKELWEKNGIDSLRSGSDYGDPLIWGYAVGKVIQKITTIFPDKKLVAQFHEWLAGSALLYLKNNNVKISTVFTTHATILGRTLASSNVDLYKYIKKFDPTKEAYNYGIEAKFLLEKQAAQKSDVFTTVSEITGIEAQYLLGRKPDVLLPNGLDMEKFPTFEEASIQHRITRNRIKSFLSYYFYPYYQVNMGDVLIYFLAGRYEFKDKGIDVFISALSKLNAKMKKDKVKKTVVAFIWVPADAEAIKQQILINKTNFGDIKDELADEMSEINERIMFNILAGKEIKTSTIFDSAFIATTKKKIMKFKAKGNPAMSTHTLRNKNDIILKELAKAGLDNSEKNPVKVIFYPIYLTGADGLLDLNYYECMQGSHLGVFPSFYEPWGYTPLEAGALGTSSVTTDLAGFGRYIQKTKLNPKTPGVFVLEREGKSDEAISNSLTDLMFKFANFTRHERVQNKINAKAIAAKADWKFLIKEYIKAHNLALRKIDWT